MFRAKDGVWFVVIGLAAAMAHPAAAAEDEQAPAEKSSAGPAADKADRFVVPEGTPKELVAYITKLITAAPPRDAATLAKLRKAILVAAEKILAAKPNDQQMEFAVQAKMNMLEKPEQLAEFAAALRSGGHEKLARQVRGFMLQVDLRKAIMTGRRDTKPIEEAVKFLEEAPPQPTDVSLAYMTGLLAEMTDDKELAPKTYTRLAKIFAASKNAKLGEFAQVLEGVVRRLSLVGQEMKIEGKVLGGGAFDWSKYLGKVVLVNFWATGYQACVREIPDLRACYDSYHNKGFEIVAISLDHKLADVEEFAKERTIPWTIVVGDGKPSPTVTYYGIMSFPTAILVGKDGKVLSLSVQGETLKKQLEKLLGPPEEKKK
jgi:thiol-disulfide isomerase/thioredoxin